MRGEELDNLNTKRNERKRRRSRGWEAVRRSCLASASSGTLQNKLFRLCVGWRSLKS